MGIVHFAKKTRNIKTCSMFTCFSRSRGGREGGGASRSLQSWQLAEFAGAPLPSTPRRGTHFAKKLGTSRPSLWIYVSSRSRRGKGRRRDQQKPAVMATCRICWSPLAVDPKMGHPFCKKNIGTSRTSLCLRVFTLIKGEG